MIFETENSVYEFDRRQNQIRRLTGKSDPTPRQGKDGEWKTVREILPFKVGESVLIVWEMVEGRQVILRSTLTSPIVKIIEN